VPVLNENGADDGSPVPNPNPLDVEDDLDLLEDVRLRDEWFPG